MKAKPNFLPLSQEQRQADAAKTTRLRALRLAKEAADREAAAALLAANPKPAAPRRRSASGAASGTRAKTKST